MSGHPSPGGGILRTCAVPAWYYRRMLCGAVTREGAEWRLTLYTVRRRRQRLVLAVVIGSAAYVQSALAAAGLGALPVLTEDGGWEAALVSGQPSNGRA
jgi:hypothetical protein